MPPTNLTRRTILVGLSAASLSAARLARAQGSGFAANLIGAVSLPVRMRLTRASPALLTDQTGVLRLAPPDAPRFDHDPLNFRPLGLLIEGNARNRAAAAADPSAALWRRSGAVELRPASDRLAPDGTRTASRVVAAIPRPGAKALVELGTITADQFATASMYLRSSNGRGAWRIGLIDGSSTRARHVTVELDERWRRFSLPMLWEFRDVGPKRIEVADLSQPLPNGHLREALLWGVQYELGNAASSLVPPGLAEREADHVTIEFGAQLAETGGMRLHLPSGGRRGGVVVDSPSGGLRLDYTESGWIGGQIGRIELRGFGDVTADTHLELSWSREGATLRSGRSYDALTARAGARANPGRIEAGGSLRLFAAMNGSRPLNRHLGGIELREAAGPIAAVGAPRLAPASYRLVFGDEFNDADVARINEHATGGRPGAPAWRSRYRHARTDIINQEKQTYMDIAYAGSAPEPLGVQPFSIRDSVLTIRAERADPERVRPFINGQAYTSGCLTTELTHWQTYGYFEMAAKLPLGKGFWPAFWLLPKAERWPPEIDVLEASGARRMSVRPALLWPVQGGREGHGEWIEGLIDITDGFHVYACEWTREAVAFFIDGVEVMRRPNPGIHEDMYLLANLALGSHDPFWIPDPDETTPFPGLMQIDYIRAYARG
jgi:beta-glucanase (GH16 family)